MSLNTNITDGGRLMKEIVYTADDEEPNCNKCCHCDCDGYLCIKQCGSEHSWNGYERIETVEVE